MRGHSEGQSGSRGWHPPAGQRGRRWLAGLGPAAVARRLVLGLLTAVLVGACTATGVGGPAPATSAPAATDPTTSASAASGPATSAPAAGEPAPSGSTTTVAAGGVLAAGLPATGDPAVPPPGSCHSVGGLPDRACTPGAINPAVTQADIHATICARGWSESVRPPEAYTESLKARQMVAYGDTQPIWQYEEDHLVPLELGGAPADPRNLWPEYGASPNPKDWVEDAANAAVCDGSMTLAAAQAAMARNWIALGTELGLGTLVPPAPGT